MTLVAPGVVVTAVRDGAVGVLGQRLAGGLVGAAEDDLLEVGAGAGGLRAEDQDDRLIRTADVLPVGGLAGPDVGRLLRWSGSSRRSRPGW